MKLFKSALVIFSIFLFVPAAYAGTPKSGIAGQVILNLCAAPSGNEFDVCLAVPQPMKGVVLATQPKKVKVRVGRKRVRQIIQIIRAAAETDEKGYFFMPLKKGTYNLVLDTSATGENLHFINGDGVKVKSRKYTTIEVVAQPN